MTRSCEGEGAYLMFRGTWHSNSGSMMIATAVVMLLASCTSSGDNNQLPPYAHRESGGAVRIDIEEAGRGLAILEQPSDSPTISKRIILGHEEDALAFGFAVISGPSTIRGTFLEDPPLRVSPRITPGDGVADFFAAVWIDDKTDELHYDLFMGTDWQDLIEGDLGIHTQAIVDGKLQLSRVDNRVVCVVGIALCREPATACLSGRHIRELKTASGPAKPLVELIRRYAGDAYGTAA